MVVVDETADLESVADMIMRSKTFDFATSCSAENSLVIQEGIHDEMVRELEEVGATFRSEEKQVFRQYGKTECSITT